MLTIPRNANATIQIICQRQAWINESSSRARQFDAPVSDRICGSMPDQFADDVRRGLTAPRKFLLPQYFYDALGSALFTAICELPEYYVTRAETEILMTHGAEIA